MYRQSIQFPAKDAALRDDVHALGGLVGEVLRDPDGGSWMRGRIVSPEGASGTTAETAQSAAV